MNLKSTLLYVDTLSLNLCVLLNFLMPPQKTQSCLIHSLVFLPVRSHFLRLPLLPETEKFCTLIKKYTHIDSNPITHNWLFACF